MYLITVNRIWCFNVSSLKEKVLNFTYCIYIHINHIKHKIFKYIKLNFLNQENWCSSLNYTPVRIYPGLNWARL